MNIEHIAIWVRDLEVMKDFYESYFGAIAGDQYHNPHKNFTSYFLRFQSGSRLELMHKPEIADRLSEQEQLGLTHLAISVGSKNAVDELTQALRAQGHTVVGEPRTTGDGYYESVVLDPENNRIEITV